MNLSFSPPAPGGDDDYPFPDDFKWYGNIQYLLNISSIGAICCVVLFLLVKLRSDHRPIPGPSALGTKLLAVWHAAGREIARHCGADAAQYLIVEGGSFAILLGTALIAVLLVLPVNIYAGTAVMDDQFSKTTITHIAKGAPVLWVHFVFVVLVVLLVHYGICEIEKRLKVTRFGDGLGNLSDTFENSSAVFTVMVKGIPRTLAANKGPFEKYFRERYPGKVHKVIVPMDLCALDEMAEELVKVRDEILKLVGKIDARLMYDENGLDEREESSRERSFNVCTGFLNKIKKAWADLCVKLGITDEESLRRLQELRAELEMEVAAYAAGRAPGAGVAFVVFKDVCTAIKTVKDFRSENKGSIGRLFPLTNLPLERNRWKVRQAPLATDIYWNHVGAAKLTVTLRKVLVNTSLLLLLLFFSSPLAVISALQRAGRIIDAEAMDNAHSWLVWVESSSWIVALVFQFLPNVLVFVSMYILIPSALSYLSKFEQHLTVSGEQRAALLKMFCFFLVNLILLRGLVESSLESAILSMGRCYLDREDCKRIEQYMSASFLSKSSLSTLAFLISCTFLGISYDLLAPIPWIKRKLQKLKKNDMLQLVPEHSDDDPFENQEIETTLHRPLISEDSFDGRANEVPNAIDYQGHALSVYPHSLSRTSPVPKQTFDFAQYYAFNLTIFALTMIYASFSPLVLPVGAVYFGYRYIVDKYNFLFVYRVRGFPAGNDGRLIDTVLSIMRFCVDLFLISMLLFFSVHGDSTKLLAIFTLAMFLIYKLLPPISDCLQPDMVQGIRTIENVVEGPIDYEVFSQPRFEWDASQY